MGITCSICEETKCIKCGVPISYYRNSSHAAIKSCRIDNNGYYNNDMSYHKWS